MSGLVSGSLAWLFAASWQIALLIGLVAAAVRLLRNASPRLRRGLWVLVLFKAILPTTLATDWSIGRWAVTPVASRVADSPGWEAVLDVARPDSPRETDPGSNRIDGRSLPIWLFGGWAVGAVGFWTLVMIGYARLRSRTDGLDSIDEGPVRVAFEQAALRIGQGNDASPDADLRIDPDATAPFLFGVRRPRIVIPQRLADTLSDDELRCILAHELLHWRRRDTWIGWLQALVQGLFWFHPLVWWAIGQMRHERECACDDAVLRHGVGDPESYGEAIIHTLTAARGAAPRAAPLVGVFEHGSLLQQRLEEVMSYVPDKRPFGWASRLTLAVFALVALPMAIQGRDATAKTAVEPAARAAAQSKPQSPYPALVESIPEIGATDVDPSLDELRVTFDRPMGKGMSWTGDSNSPEFPPIDKMRKVTWIDDRTCVFPVKLQKGAFYRIGINSTSYQNFAGADGKPAEHRVIAFSTKGAKRSVKRKAHVPEIAELSPANGESGVDPSTKIISVKFDTKMGGGMSWVRTNGAFPGSQNGRAWWSKDGRTCHLPVELQPGATYELSLNGSHHVNFQSKSGVPLPATAWGFTTAAE